MNLNALLKKKIKSKGPLSFEAFMQLALYHPEFGYYQIPKEKIGKNADFVTAPELTPLFGQCLALHFYPILKSMNQPTILEFGAGNGTLCVDILKQLETLGLTPQYIILEVSAYQRSMQEHAIKQRIPHLSRNVQWITSWPAAPIEGIILANEVLDAMPVYRFLKNNEGIFDSYITINQNDELEESFIPTQHPLAANYIKEKLCLTELQTPYISEINFHIDSWIEQCAKSLNKGLCLIIDYGFPRHEYYHADRSLGTLMCHAQQKSHCNFLARPGLDDITAHVDFTHLAEAAVDAGFHVAGYTNQASFLLENGLLSLISEVENARQYEEKKAVLLLTQPQEMGELFKVIALTKAYDHPLAGFQIQDKRASL